VVQRTNLKIITKDKKIFQLTFACIWSCARYFFG